MSPRRRSIARLLSVAVLLTVVVRAGAEDDEASTAPAPDPIHIARARRLARDVQPALVRIEWRRRGDASDMIERHAVVIDPDGWLLLAGPLPSPAGTLAATLEDGRAMRAEVWASDAATCLTLLRVPARRLPPLSLREVVDPPAETDPADGDEELPADALVPARLPPGSPFVLVTAPFREGQSPALARGFVRASHRRRWVDDPARGRPVEVTCLDEAALAVLPTDLGAPWLDRDGRIVGLLVGADIGSPHRSDDGGDVEVRPEVTAAYAVPAEVIRIVWPLLRVKRRVPRSLLGALVGPLSDAARHQLCPGCGGFQILDLAPDGPGQRGGLEVRDILLGIDGRRMAPDADLTDVLLGHRPGHRVRLHVLRRGEPLELDVVLGRAE